MTRPTRKQRDEADTAEIARYDDWLGEVQTDQWTRPAWFTNDTEAFPTVKRTARRSKEVAPRIRGYKGRHRRRETVGERLKGAWLSLCDWFVGGSEIAWDG